MPNVTDDFTIGKPSTAAPTDRFDKANHQGRLLLFVSPELEEDVETQFGTANAAQVAYIVVLDGDSVGEVWKDQMLFGAALVPALTGGDAEIVAGRLTQGEAKPGRNAPWILEPADAAGEKTAQSWVDAAVKDGTLRRNRNGRIVIDPDVAPF